MKTMSKITIGLVAATLLFVGCNESATPASNNGVGETVTEISLGLRKTDLYSETTETYGDAAHYSKQAAGTSTKIKRAFQDAPPMIPHDVKDMLPITINNNQCIACHDPMVAKDMGATPYPTSHMINFRPTHNISADGKDFTKSINNMKNEVDIKQESKLVGARFNCSQCHAPQSGDALAVENTFEADFTSADGATASSWTGTKLMEGIDTINGK